mgnify:CR=1 FL=1
MLLLISWFCVCREMLKFLSKKVVSVNGFVSIRFTQLTELLFTISYMAKNLIDKIPQFI